MSGVVGILQLDGAPVDPLLLQRLTDFQSFRGPDAKQTWINGPVGFGHTLLRTTQEAEFERQPFSLNGEVWIVADARVDARRDLVVDLRAQGHKNLADVTDADLILRAYQVWGEGCLEHLLGDFAFAIWDGPRQKLFCARDQMGVKPFYYAHLGSQVIFSNTLDCVRQHPSVSDRLNDLAIADFLLFEMNVDPATTTFADIQRLPPAHKAVWSGGGLRKSRYWTLPIEEPVFYKRSDDYTDRFKELLPEAVGDRLRTSRATILMSGGLDSPTLAAAARDLSRERSPRIELRAFTTIATLTPNEHYYADMVARHLEIPVEYNDWEQHSLHPDWERIPFRTSEPVSSTVGLPIHPTYWDQVGSFSRVFLQGEGPDNALFCDWRPYVSYLLRRRRFWRFFRDSCLYLTSQRRIPFWGKITGAIRKVNAEAQPRPSFPEWLNTDLESRFALRGRWEMFHTPPSSNHPTRPVAYALLQVPEIEDVFRGLDAENIRLPLEVRFPFMDLRLLRFFLAVPPIPWCRSKYLLRRAMKSLLPDPVLRRPKEGVACALIMERVGSSGLGQLEPAPNFDSYVDVERLPNTIGNDFWELGVTLRARLLNHWLQYSQGPGYNT